MNPVYNDLQGVSLCPVKHRVPWRSRLLSIIYEAADSYGTTAGKLDLSAMLNNSCETTLTWQILFMTPHHAYGSTFISARWRVLQYTKGKKRLWSDRDRAESGTITWRKGCENVSLIIIMGVRGWSINTQRSVHRISYPLCFHFKCFEIMPRYVNMSLLGENMTDFSSFLGSNERIKPSSICYTHTLTHTT